MMDIMAEGDAAAWEWDEKMMHNGDYTFLMTLVADLNLEMNEEMSASIFQSAGTAGGNSIRCCLEDRPGGTGRTPPCAGLFYSLAPALCFGAQFFNRIRWTRRIAALREHHVQHVPR